MVISTWFLVDKEFNLKRFVKTWIQVLFYSIVFSVFSVFLGTDFSWRNWFSIFFPIAGNSHGFAATYLAFYLLVPFLGMISKNIQKTKLLVLIFLLGYFQVISKIIEKIGDYKMPILSSELTLFIFFYFLSLYLKKHSFPILKSKRSMIVVFVTIWIAVFGIWCLRGYLGPKTYIVALLFSFASDESSILYILAGYVLFFIFKGSKVFYNKTVNYIAHASFGVLLFHDHNFFRYQLWENVLDAQYWYYKNEFIFWIIGCVIIIYLIGLLIDSVRENITERFLKCRIIENNIFCIEQWIKK